MSVQTVVSAVGVSPALQADLLKLGKGMLVASVDAGLVYFRDNLSKSDNLGTWGPLATTLANVVVTQLRNMLHGVQVSGEDVLKSLDVKVVEEHKVV